MGKRGPLQRSIQDRFWQYVDKDGPTISEEIGKCWEWTASTYSNGYGQICTSGRLNRKNCLAHKVSYEIAYGAIPEGSLVLHKCDYKLCVNPDHLHLGDKTQNAIDYRDRGRFRDP